MRYIAILLVFTLVGCTDAKRASIAAYGLPATVTCYSGGQVIYSGKSTGRVSATEGSDGWEFKDATTRQFVRVSGDCVVLN
jgi:hypothetical protein